MDVNNDFKVTIITVSYNSSNTIEQTICSVINQSYSNIEYIIIDGGSTDKTVEIIKKYEDRIAYWISEPDKGIYDAMNKGIKKASGDIIGIINSDDWYEKDAVKIAVDNLIGQHDYYGVCGNIFYYDEYGTIMNVNSCKSNPDCLAMQRRMSIAHPSVFVKKEFYEQFGLFDVSFKIAADYELFLRAFLGSCKLLYLSSLNVNFRLGGASTQKSILSIEEAARARRKNNICIKKRVFYFLYDVFIYSINIFRNIVVNKK